MADARFEDADRHPLRLNAETQEDLEVVSSLLQDAVLQSPDISWQPRKRRFAMLLNRFRWEDKAAAERSGRAYERVRSLLVVESVLSVKSSGVDPMDKDLVFSVLSLAFEPTDDVGGKIRVILAGDGEIVVAVECVEAVLKDVTRPYAAVSGLAPSHSVD